MKVELIASMGSDLTCANAARVSMNKENGWEVKDGKFVLSDKDKKLINYLAKHQHTSCFEHQTATLRLKVPIFIARQIQRHRTFSYNEISRRYVDTPPEFFWPDKWRKKAENVKQGSSDEAHDMVILHGTNGKDGVTDLELECNEVVEYALSVYKSMLKEGVAPEQARMILPQNLYTEFYMTGSLRNWHHFLKLRLDGHAQQEVRDVAQQVATILKDLWPTSVEALMTHG